MNWCIYRINNYRNITTPEANTASRSLNRFTLCMMVSRRHKLSRLSPTALLDRRRANSPDQHAPSTTNVTKKCDCWRLCSRGQHS